ncbi:MAG: hypothetical protein RLP44_14515 [Aggregatilineales bacterium]
MNEFDMQVHSTTRQQQLTQESQQWRLSRLAKSEQLRDTPLITETTAHMPPLARFGELLIAWGEGLKARYGDALDTLPAPTTGTQPKSV